MASLLQDQFLRETELSGKSISTTQFGPAERDLHREIGDFDRSGNSGKFRRLAILQPVISDYRVPFYRRLAEELAKSAVELTVIASRPVQETALRDGIGELPFARHIQRTDFGSRNYWQGGPAKFFDFDMVILQQELRALSNYPVLFCRQAFGRPGRVGLWGHGTNLHAPYESSVARTLRWMLNRSADHFFAYTALSRQKFIDGGADPDRITVVNNSIDTSDILAESASLENEQRITRRREIGLGEGPVGAFCARLIERKRLPFLVEACRLVRRHIPDFSLLVIGDGPARQVLKDFDPANEWIRPVGALYGSDKAKLLCLADCLCMPFDLGLSILDGFGAGLPVVATRNGSHGAEIAYLRDGHNGAMSEPSAEAYAAAVIDVLENRGRLSEMSRNARGSAQEYSLDAMIENFAAGVLDALDAEKTLEWLAPHR